MAVAVALAATLAASPVAEPPEAPAGQDAPPATFRSSVNLVSVSAVVRDGRGRVMRSLQSSDFEVFDGGQRRDVIDIHADSNAPLSVGLLIDGSGSMRLGSAQAHSRRISADVLTSLNPARDTAALLSFDTRLLTLCPFTSNFSEIWYGLETVEAFGSTSIYDAVAGSAALVAERALNRRAVILLTDGFDNASTYTPEKVAFIASTIDVPVYVFDVGDRPADEDDLHGRESRAPLAEVARATGGELFVANTPKLMAAGVKRVTEELRHQYVIAFEAAPRPGMRKIEIRTRKRDLRVQARNWYQASEN
jgi:VWFA-related protein